VIGGVVIGGVVIGGVVIGGLVIFPRRSLSEVGVIGFKSLDL
jgi:hypothetical protein